MKFILEIEVKKYENGTHNIGEVLQLVAARHVGHILYEGLPKRRDIVTDAEHNVVGRWRIQGDSEHPNVEVIRKGE